MNKPTFMCSCCKQTYEQSRTDEEALTEALVLYPDVPFSELVIVCTDCFIEIQERKNRVGDGL